MDDIIITSVPVNEHELYKTLFPRRRLEDDPVDLIQPKTVIIDTRFRHIAYFHKLVDLLRSKGVVCGLITDLPFDLVERDLAKLEPFDFSIFFDRYILEVYPFAKTAAHKALEMVGQSTMAFMPQISSLSYLEMISCDENLPHACMSLITRKESYTFCNLIAGASREANQFKSLISCPRYLEVQIQESAHYPVIVDGNSNNIKVTRVYWLNQEQLVEQTERFRTFHETKKQLFLSPDFPNEQGG